MLWSGSATTHEDEMDDDITTAGDERYVPVTHGVFY